LEGKASSDAGEHPEGEEQAEQRRRGKPQRRKTEQLTIHETKPVKATGVPEDSEFKGYRRYVVQDLELGVHNTCFGLEQWQTPSGE
jgi:hypothetical protein